MADVNQKRRRPEAAHGVLDPDIKRYVHLDMMRVLCVFFVVIDHGWGGYSLYNVIFVQSWVLQLLWIICGISWSLTKMGICGYLLRLGTYFVVGTLLNLLAWIAKGKDWQSDILGCVFQFAFIAALMTYALFTVPLKALLRRWAASDRIPDADAAGERTLERGLIDHEMGETPVAATSSGGGGKPLSSSEKRALMIFTAVLAVQWVTLAVLGSVFAVMGETDFVARLMVVLLGESAKQWTDGLEDKQFLSQILATFGALLLATVGARVFTSPRLSHFNVWVMMFVIYMNRIVILPLCFQQYGGGVARYFVGFELFIMGLTGAVAGMRHAGLVRHYMVLYYMPVVITLTFLWNPTWVQRMDNEPPEVWGTICRVQLSEVVWVVAFMAAGATWFTKQAWPDWLREYLSDCSLAWFLVHKAIHVAVPEPFNWITLFLPIPLLLLIRRHGLRFWVIPARYSKGDSASSAPDRAEDRAEVAQEMVPAEAKPEVPVEALIV